MGAFRKFLHWRYTHMGVAALFSLIHVAVIFAATFPAATALWLFPLFFLLPGVLTMILLPGAWRHWYRWLVLAFLCVTVAQDALAVVLFTGQAWALYRSWFVERTIPLGKLFSPRRAAKVPAKAATGPTTVAEAMSADKAATASARRSSPAKNATGPATVAEAMSKKAATAYVRRPRPAKVTAASKRAAVQAAKSATVRKTDDHR